MTYRMRSEARFRAKHPRSLDMEVDNSVEQKSPLIGTGCAGPFYSTSRDYATARGGHPRVNVVKIDLSPEPVVGERTGDFVPREVIQSEDSPAQINGDDPLFVQINSGAAPDSAYLRGDYIK